MFTKTILISTRGIDKDYWKGVFRKKRLRKFKNTLAIEFFVSGELRPEDILFKRRRGLMFLEMHFSKYFNFEHS